MNWREALMMLLVMTIAFVGGAVVLFWFVFLLSLVFGPSLW